jgi:quercetin dioxygenase-like cupin family protein
VDEFPAFVLDLPRIAIPLEYVTGYLIQGARHQVVFVHFERETVVPTHSHRAQWELVVTGEVRLEMGGGVRTYTPGESFYISEGKEHGATVGADYRAIIIFDQPDRYLPEVGPG